MDTQPSVAPRAPRDKRRHCSGHGGDAVRNHNRVAPEVEAKILEHRTTKVRSPRTNGFVERMNRTLLDECFRVAGRQTWYLEPDERTCANASKNSWSQRSTGP